jgi:hypothetical protein
MADRLRLKEFCTLIGETGPAVRGMLVREEVPFDRGTETGSHRTYDGGDLLAWCLFTQLRRAGMTTPVAADVVKLSRAVPEFLDALGRGADVSDMHVIAHVTRRDRAHRGLPTMEVFYQFTGTSADVADLLRKESQGYGSPDNAGDTRLGTVALITVPIMPCYDRSRATATAHGFAMDGATLVEAES